MNRKWNLQDIKPPQSSREKSRAAPPKLNRQDMRSSKRSLGRSTDHEYTDPNVASIDVIDGNSRRKKRIIVSIIIVLAILFAGFFLNVLMGGAELSINPKMKEVTVQATFTASKSPQADELGYELLSLESEGERQVAASGEEDVAERATGEIFIYNAYSNTSQRLIKNTRFESPDGLIFRINESVEVPGSTTDNDGNIIPGIITAKVFADGVGTQYNVEASRFTIPGLKDTDQYDTVYAESTSAMGGGFEGKRFIIDDAELTTAKQALQAELRNALLERLESEQPAGFILYPDAVTFVFETLPATEYGDQLATIKESARLQVPLFSETEFAEYIAKNTIAGFENELVLIENPKALKYSYPDLQTLTSDISTQDNLKFNLSGAILIVWQYDEEQLRTDLAGLSKTALPSVLGGYPAIDRAEAVVRPFWRQTFPNKAEDILVERILGDNSQEE